MMQYLPTGTNQLPGKSGWKKSQGERQGEMDDEEEGGGVKAGVEVCCINVLYSKSHVGGLRPSTGR